MQRRPSAGNRTSRPIAGLAPKLGRDDRFIGTPKPPAASAPTQRPKRRKKK